eukprot:CAMPEP_0202797120 /NCGR_PEP_ID=MMETSP1388-20130828/93505_1 /ASSEMBLY_ACC=CAM_ASM_000864 /TAXON_ID=37098 /ORGANISM="Isochrysis sp, Strain CCMP1244" /LENGTH=110 /DNA_ID=CAMNT_0049467027 /DNA_START=99 /DNA_END=427 /DNA_ORIENTATION=+
MIHTELRRRILDAARCERWVSRIAARTSSRAPTCRAAGWRLAPGPGARGGAPPPPQSGSGRPPSRRPAPAACPPPSTGTASHRAHRAARAAASPARRAGRGAAAAWPAEA